jgi:hypothetical protein
VKMKLKFDVVAILAAIRTAGALMLGNVAIAAIVLNNRNYVTLVALFVLGCVTIAAGALVRKE